MNIIQYHINQRPLSAFAPLGHETHYEPHKNYLFDLSYLSILKVEGDRGREFLQGQLTCDLNEVSNTVMRPGVACNLKGRIMALLDVIDWHGLRLVLPKDMLDETERLFTKPALFSKVKLSPATGCHLFGFYFQNPEDLIPLKIDLPRQRFESAWSEHSYCYHIGHNLYVLICSSSLASECIQQFSAVQSWHGALGWHELRLKFGYFEIYPSTRGLFLPHRLGLHLNGHLNFQKGCYKGQEIIARMHYRGKIKHEMKRFLINLSEPPKSGSKLISEADQKEVGELIDYCPLGQKQYLILASILPDAPKKVLIQDSGAIAQLNIEI